MRVLGIETSCDDTAVAIVNSQREILAHVRASQVDIHQKYGGIVPEKASRAHLVLIRPVIQETLARAHMDGQACDGIAVTAGPGLMGSLMVGVMAAKALAAAFGKPLLAVNHLEGHALTVRLTHGIDFPYLLLLISGGHCQFVLVSGVGHYRLLGTTLDDALGETFDKVARLLGLPYPGGPEIENKASSGSRDSFAFPRPLCDRKTCDFSFSGLKTAVRLQVESLLERHGIEKLQDSMIANIAASFQSTVADILQNRLEQAVKQSKIFCPGISQVVVAGGVAANAFLRDALDTVCQAQEMQLVAPPSELCTDNGAMIAWAGLERLRMGYQSPWDFLPRARWPLEKVNCAYDT